jgi:tetratricopeptide (TPR) repeat protein
VSIISVVQVPRFRYSKDTEYKRAAKMLAEGYVQESIDLLRDILEERPDNMNARITLAVALMQAQESPDANSPLTEDALRQLDIAAAQNTKDPVPYFNKGVLQRNVGQLEEALQSFESARKTCPRERPGFGGVNGLGPCSYEKGGHA